MQIAEFFASLRIKPDQQSIHRADRWLKTFEKRLQRSARRVEKSNVLGTMLGLKERKVTKQVQRTLDVVSKTAVFRIENFKLNTKRLKKSIDSVLKNNTTPLTIHHFKINRFALRKQLEMAAGSFEIPVKVAPSRARTPRGQGTAVNNAPRVSSGGGGRGRFSITPRGIGIGMGGVGIFGGLGIASLNRKISELEMLPVMMESVTGSKANAQRELAFLNELGNLVGAPTTELASDYTKILASAMGTPLEGKIQSGFASLTKYGKVMGLDSQSMKLSFRAFSQMIGKQQIMAEELKNQAAEHLPGIVRIMAEVAAGGDTKKLFKMMEAGQLDPNKYLPLLFEELEARAAGGWNAYINTTRYQQNQTTKRFEDFIKAFSGSGGSEGFFRIWKAFADTLPKLENTAKALGQAFNWFGEQVQSSMNIILMFNDAITWFQQQTPSVQTSLESLAAGFVLLKTKVGRALAPLLALYMVIEDLAVYRQGGKSVIGLAMGEDYSSKAPDMLAYDNPYKDKPYGGLVEAARRQAVSNPTLLNKTLHQVSKFNSTLQDNHRRIFTGAWHVVRKPTDVLDGLRQMMPWNWGEVQPMPAENMHSLIQSMSGIDSIMGGGSSSQFRIDNITINAQTNDPVEHAHIFQKEIQKTLVNLPIGEGGG